MSRRSQAFSQGQPAFSWKVQRIEQDAFGKPTRFMCECRNHPQVKGFGDTEEQAIRAASKAMEHAVEQVDFGHVGKTQELTAAPVDASASAAPSTDA